MEHKSLYGSLIRLHILHHAVHGDTYGQWMIEELGRHGYRLSAGTLYPLLHDMEKKGYLVSTPDRKGSARRRVYRATQEGADALTAAKARLRELFGELFEDDDLTGGRPEP